MFSFEASLGLLKWVVWPGLVLVRMGRNSRGRARSVHYYSAVTSTIGDHQAEEQHLHILFIFLQRYSLDC